MQPHKNTPKKANSNHQRKHKPRRQPHKETVAVNSPAVNAQAEGWGSSANPWPDTIDESDVSKEIISAWRQNVYAVANGGELQKMEDLYNRLDREREKWNERLNNPLTWGWGGGEPDKLNDWAKETKEVTGWGDQQPDDLNNWTNDAAYEPCQAWGGHQQANSDNTPDGPSNPLNAEQAPPPLPQLVFSHASKLNADGRQRSYEFTQLPTEAKAERIREVAYQLRAVKKH
ncbi:hypothetical protein BJ322DRAFT_717487 [Thelephora terrestris]|uniref:Uncharacterized protein n=1 Tax=Thelephora terrestris TaxID=56493 RepID=A0A9P6HJK9_9AGAM|nr:hypothetical protein BJ322DRAFT_717487 [Thelephora terrestris]